MKRKRTSLLLVVCCLLLVFSFSACDQEDEDFSEEAYYDGEEYLDDEVYLDDEQEQYDAQEENPEQEPLTYNDEPSDQGDGDGYWWGYDYEDESYGEGALIQHEESSVYVSVQAVAAQGGQYQECMEEDDNHTGAIKRLIIDKGF